MNNNKNPGSDGISTEFFKIFWNDLKSFNVKSFNYSFEFNNLTKTRHYISIACKDND